MKRTELHLSYHTQLEAIVYKETHTCWQIYAPPAYSHQRSDEEQSLYEKARSVTTDRELTNEGQDDKEISQWQASAYSLVPTSLVPANLNIRRENASCYQVLEWSQWLYFANVSITPTGENWGQRKATCERGWTFHTCAWIFITVMNSGTELLQPLKKIPYY